MGASLTADDLILGIETSCDETAAAVVRGGREIVSNVVASQDDLHARFGGVVPEIASRKHAETITVIVAEALQRAAVSWDDLAGIAVTNGPGLVGSLLVGVAAAKGYALATGLPLVGVNHIEAHVLANWLRPPDAASPPAQDLFPTVCLIASGGHSDIVLIQQLGEYRILGWTRDDAAGEALDKAARVLGLGYPGGPAIERAAREGNPQAIGFPRPIVADSHDFSFSGLKTALVRQAHAVGTERPFRPTREGPNTRSRRLRPKYPARSACSPMGETTDPVGAASSRDLPPSAADLAASFQEAVVDTLVRNTTQAAIAYKARQVLLAGGVAANSRLRAKMSRWQQTSGILVAAPAPNLCTDNAAMVAAAGFFKAARTGWDPLDMDVFSAMPMAEHV